MSSSEMTVRCKTINYYTFRLRRLSKRNSIRVLGLNRMRKVGKDSDCEKEKRETKRRMEMEMRNLKLYMENQGIMEENQKLRKRALLLHQENQALFSRLQHVLLSKQNGNVAMENICQSFK